MMAQVNAGRVRFVGRGEYNNSTQYYVFDLVNYNGNSYYAKADTIGNLPTNTTYWQLVAEKGNVGPIGLTGNGISSITKTGTSVLVDSYTITFTNGNTTTFDVTNGKGIDRIEKTATVGNIDTYTIYFNDNSTSTFEVANGEVTREELEEEVDRLNMIYNLFPTTSDEDTEMTLDGTGEVKLKKIGLKGNTYQKTSILPSEYTQVDYITGDGTAYINTGKTLGANFIIKTTFIHNQKVNHEQAVFSTWSDDYKWFNTYIVTNSNACRTHVLGNYNPTSNLLTIGDKNDVIISRNSNDWRFTLNNQYVDFTSEISTTNSNPLTLFKRADLLGSSAYISIYETKVFESDVLTMDLIPCYRNSDNEVGMYDIIGNAFYTNSASTGAFTYGSVITIPNPDYPQDIHVVTGDNEVSVCGRNVVNKEEIKSTYLNNWTTEQVSNGVKVNHLTSYTTGMPETNLNLIPNTNYTFKCSISSTTSQTIPGAILTIEGTNYYINANTIKNFTTGASGEVRLRIGNATDMGANTTYTNIMIVKGTYTSGTMPSYEPYTSSSYQVNLGNIELCKIGDYQDKIVKSTGKNLFDKSNTTQGYIKQDGTITTANVEWKISDYIKVIGGDNYTYQGLTDVGNSPYSAYYDENETFISSFKQTTGNNTITIPNNACYVRFSIRISNSNVSLNDLNTFMIEKGNQATSYEPYGKVWYLNKQIGKYVYNNDLIENGISETTVSMLTPVLNVTPNLIDTTFKNRSYANMLTNKIVNNSGLNGTTSTNKIRIALSTNYATTFEGARNIYSNGNLTIYYGLQTPTITEITDTTLIEQLDNLENAYSYDTQTNITQTNDDMPFILDVEALMSLKGVLN